MTTFLKKLLNRGNRKYTYKLNRSEPIYIKNNELYCIITELGYMEPMHLPVRKVLSDPSYHQEINPQELMLLQKQHYQFENKKNKVRVISEYRNNEYSISSNNVEIRKISGDNLCEDLGLLESMSIKDAFSIIYKTAYRNGMTDAKKINKISCLPTQQLQSKFLYLVEKEENS